MKTFPNKILTKSQAEQALDTAVALVRQNLPLYTDHCQNHSSVHDIYPQCENNQWTCGFWPGEVWLSYERTGDAAFKNTALTLVDSFLYRIENKIEVDHHDMGFLYSPSCVAAYKLTGSEKGRRAAILAADQLCTRFQEKGSFFQAWGPLGAKDNYRYIIDCLLNVPLLYWASETTGDAHYAELAHRHVTTCLANSIRPDGSTYHTFFMDPVTGAPVRGATCQGYKDDSCWARGQAWGVYGTAISYRYTKRPEYLEAFRRVLSYYLDRLPEDLIPYWDMTFTEGDTEPRDSSSASIVACGLLVRQPRSGCGVHAAGGPDAGQRGRALCRQAGAAGHRPCAPRHLQQKEPLQHLHAGGRGRVRELGRLLLHGRSDPADEGLDPLLVT